MAHCTNGQHHLIDLFINSFIPVGEECDDYKCICYRRIPAIMLLKYNKRGPSS